MDTPQDSAEKQSRLVSVAKQLANLDLLFGTTAQTFTLGATQAVVAEKNVFRTYIRFSFVSGFAAQIIINPSNPSSTYLLLNAQNPFAEFFIEKDKQVCTSQWNAVAPGGATVLTVIQTQYRGQ
jgi:hypothetical protein